MIRKLRDLYRVYQMKQLIKEPTGSTLTTATIIDHFATNKPNLIVSSGVFAHDPLVLKENQKSAKHGN